MIRKFKTFNFTAEIVKKNPNRTAIIEGDEKISFQTLANSVAFAASKLKEFFKQGEIVPVLSENNADFIIAIYALWTIGAIPAPLNIMLSETQLSEMLEILGTEKYLSHKNINKLPPDLAVDMTELYGEISEINSREFSPNARALILFTSGSSGKPKAVLFTFENLFANTKNVIKYFRARRKDAWLASLPFYHIGGFAIIVRALLASAPVILPKSLSFNEQLNVIEKTKPAFFSVVQTTLKRLVESGVKPYPQLKSVFAGGGPINSATMKAAIERGFPVHKVYGSTETTSMITILSPRQFKKFPESAGKPFKKIKLEISPQNEIVVEGEQISIGYFNDEDETKKRFQKNKFYTGDVGYVNEKGFLFITGRKEDFIITGGENVNLQKVKKAILALEEISDAETFSLPDEEWGEKLCAAIVVKTEISDEKLKEKLSPLLGKYEIPKQLFRVNEIPRDHLGKAKIEELKKVIAH